MPKSRGHIVAPITAGVASEVANSDLSKRIYPAMTAMDQEATIVIEVLKVQGVGERVLVGNDA